MKKLLLLPILLCAFNALAMEYLDEAQRLFEQSEASKIEEASQRPFASQQRGEQTLQTDDEHDDKKEGYEWYPYLKESWWKLKYGCKYCPKGGCKQTEMFDCKGLLRNPYWQKVMKMSQEEKDDILAEMMKEPKNNEYPDKHYWAHRRCHIAAAICAGANPNTKSKEEYWERPLFNILRRDPPMTKLLLEHGANPELNIVNPKWLYTSKKDPAICNVKTLKEAELLFEYGANPNAKCAFNFNPIHRIISFNRGGRPRTCRSLFG